MSVASIQSNSVSATLKKEDTLSLSIVVPCYNEQDVIATLLERAHAAAQKAVGDDYELILIDDGSRDETWRLIDEAANSGSRTIGVRLSRNHGHQLALSAGLSVSRGNLVFVIDADLQDPPELLVDMIEKLKSLDADVVYGKRISRANESTFKKLTARSFYRMLAKSSDVNLPLDAGDFRLMTRRVAKALVSMPEQDRFVRGMVAWLGLKQVPFEYHRDARFAGETKYPLRNMLRLAKQAFMGFSMLPLKFALQLSMFMFLIMIAVIGYAIASYIFFATVSGWASLTILIAFSSGIQLLVLGILGEYIGRLYMTSKNRPLFLVDEVQGIDGNRLADLRQSSQRHVTGVFL